MSRFRNFTPQAADDLDQAISYLLDHGADPHAAERILAAVLAAGERLATRPLLARQRLDLLPAPYRFWSLPRFGLLLVIDATPRPATVMRVLNTAQDVGPLIADLRPDQNESSGP